MRERVGLVLVLMLAAACSADPAGPQTAAEEPAADDAAAWLDRIEATARGLRTLQARIVYDRISPLTGDQQRRLGTLIYDAGPPGRFAVHLDRLIVDAGGGQKRAEPQDRWFIFDGRWLLERDHDQRTAVRRELVRPDRDPSSVDLLGDGDGPFILPLRATKQAVLDRYDAALGDDGDEQRLHIVLTPHDPDRAGVESVELWYDRATLLPVKARTLAEDESILTLLEPRVNEAVDAAAFETALPTDAGWTTDVRPYEP